MQPNNMTSTVENRICQILEKYPEVLDLKGKLVPLKRLST